MKYAILEIGYFDNFSVQPNFRDFIASYLQSIEKKSKKKMELGNRNLTRT